MGLYYSAQNKFGRNLVFQKSNNSTTKIFFHQKAAFGVAASFPTMKSNIFFYAVIILHPMKNTITDEDLVKYLYNESGVYESIALEEAMEEDQALTRRYHDMASAHQLLNAVPLMSPPAALVGNIISYYKTAHLEEELFEG